MVNHKKTFDAVPIARTDSLVLPKDTEIAKPKVVSWQNQSFGDSEDHRIFESKRLVDITPDDSDNDNDAGNFSFCESNKKTQPRTSGGEIHNSKIRYSQEKPGDDMNLFAQPVSDERKNLEKMLRRPTTIIVPSYIDTGDIISYR